MKLKGVLMGLLLLAASQAAAQEEEPLGTATQELGGYATCTDFIAEVAASYTYCATWFEATEAFTGATPVDGYIVIDYYKHPVPVEAFFAYDNLDPAFIRGHSKACIMTAIEFMDENKACHNSLAKTLRAVAVSRKRRQ